MEESRITFLSGKLEYEKSRENIAKCQEEQRFLYYNKEFYSFNVYRVKETPTHVYWGEVKYVPRFNNKLFYTARGISGITLEKATKTVNIWYGKRPPDIITDSFYNYINFNSNVLPGCFRGYFTTSLIKDIVKGKITDIDTFALHLSKKSLMFKSLDPKLISKLMNQLNLYMPDYFVSLEFIGKYLKVVKNPETAIDYFVTGMYSVYSLEHVVDQAIALGEQIDIYNDESRGNEYNRIAGLSARFRAAHNVPENNVLPF